jgi:hypothetical protein
LTTKIESKNNLCLHRHFTEHLVGAFGKSRRESDLHQEPSSLLIWRLKNYTGFTLQPFTHNRNNRFVQRFHNTIADNTWGRKKHKTLLEALLSGGDEARSRQPGGEILDDELLARGLMNPNHNHWQKKTQRADRTRAAKREAAGIRTEHCGRNTGVNSRNREHRETQPDLPKNSTEEKGETGAENRTAGAGPAAKPMKKEPS